MTLTRPPARAAFALAALIAAFAACGDDPASPARPADLEFESDSLILAAGTEDTVHVTVRTAGGDILSGARVTWSSSDEAIISVDSAGVVHADSSGVASLVATVDTIELTIPVRVFQQIARLDWDGPPLGAPLVGTEKPLHVVATDGAGREVLGAPISWRSEDTLIVTVTPDGIATARNWGWTNVVATSGDVELTLGVNTAPTAVGSGVTLRSLSGSGYPFEMHWFACGIETTSAQDVYCFGYNSAGQFGNGTKSTTETLDLTPSATGHGFSAVGAGRTSACGLKTDGTIWCWGADGHGTLGQDTSITESLVPVRIAGGLTFKSLSVGPDNYACAIATDDVPYCWGRNTYETLGRVTTGTYDSVPRPVAGGLTAKALGTGLEGACLVTLDGAPWCWGTHANQGQVTATPVAISGTPALVSIVYIDGSACGLTALPAGEVWCWGTNFSGELGAGATTPYSVWHAPRLIEGLPALTKLVSGRGLVCGLTADGQLWCWGRAYTSKSAPVGTVAPGPRRFSPPGAVVRDVTMDVDGYTCVLMASVHCWRPAP